MEHDLSQQSETGATAAAPPAIAPAPGRSTRVQAPAEAPGRRGGDQVEADSSGSDREERAQEGGGAAAPTINPRPLVDASGTNKTVHANPTIADAVNTPVIPPAGTESRAANVRVVADISKPLQTPPAMCPRPDLIYEEQPAGTSPAPEGFTSVNGFNGTATAPQIEQVMSPAIFVNGTPSPNDVQQGGIGDCYFMATLMSISQRDPGKLRSMMTPDGTGGATVTFWRRTMTNPNWLSKMFGAKPEPQYSQVNIHVSEQLQYWLQTPLGSGQRIANGRGGFHLKGAALRCGEQARGAKWWSKVASSQLEVHRRDEYDTALWAPLMEKAYAAFTERYGHYGGSQGEGPAAGSGYDEINGGWSQQAMFVFYGAQADMAGANDGNVQQQPTQWAPGSQVLAQNPRVVDQLLLLQGRGEQPAAGEQQAPIVTATSMVHLLIPRLRAAIPVAQADADWANITATEQTNVASITAAVNLYSVLPNDAGANGPKAQARAAIGTACSTAITVANAPELLKTTRSPAIRQMVELILDLKNIGTDNSPGQRNIYGDHVYSVVGVNFSMTSGTPVPLGSVPAGARTALYPLVDTTVSNITLRNPHHSNQPDATNAGTGPDGPTQGPQSSGIFHMTLEQFFMNFTSVESGVFPKS